MASEKITFTSSQELSDNRSLATNAAGLSLSCCLAPFMRPDSLAGCSHIILIDLFAAEMGLLCVMLLSIMLPDNDSQKGIP